MANPHLYTTSYTHAHSAHANSGNIYSCNISGTIGGGLYPAHCYNGMTAVYNNPINKFKKNSIRLRLASMMLMTAFAGNFFTSLINKFSSINTDISVTRSEISIARLKDNSDECDSVLYDGYSPDDVIRESYSYNIMDVI